MTKLLTTKRLVPNIVALVYFMETMDSTILNTAIPVISNSLQVEPIDLKIALISYLLGLAIFIPISGWLADKFGIKKVFVSALCIFTLSSLWCGFAHNLIELIIARFIQGFGGAFGLPVGRLILLRTFGRHNFVSKMNHVIIIGALGMMFGPIVSGIITHHVSWQWIFWVNIPVGIFALLLSVLYLEETKPGKVHPLDIIGFLLFGISLAGFTFGLSALSETTISHSLSNSILLVSVILMGAYVFHSHNRPNPIVKTDLLRIKTFNISVTANLISRLGFGGIPFLLPLIYQINFGFSAQLSGVLLAPMAIGILISKPLSIPLLRFFGYKRILIVNTLCSSLSIFLFSFISVNTSLYLICLLTFFFGFILALQYGAMNSLAYANIENEDLSAVTSIMGTIQQLAQSFGVAICALLIRFFSAIYSTETLTLTIFHETLIVMACLTLASCFIFLRLGRYDGQEMVSPGVKHD